MLSVVSPTAVATDAGASTQPSSAKVRETLKRSLKLKLMTVKVKKKKMTIGEPEATLPIEKLAGKSVVTGCYPMLSRHQSVP